MISESAGILLDINDSLLPVPVLCCVLCIAEVYHQFSCCMRVYHLQLHVFFIHVRHNTNPIEDLAGHVVGANVLMNTVFSVLLVLQAPFFFPLVFS